MARNVKCRRVCCEPRSRLFIPEDGGGAEPLTLSVVELEALRLCDLEGLEQAAAAKKMGVSRGTFQRVLYTARRQVARALLAGNEIRIQGGHYTLEEQSCGHGCRSCPFRQGKEASKPSEGEVKASGRKLHP